MDQKKIKDLMLPLDEYATIGAACTIREALLALDRSQLGLDDDRHHHRAVLALDAEGNVVGKLSHWAVLKSVEPKLFGEVDTDTLARANLGPEYVRGIRDTFHLFRGNFARMCRLASHTRVADAMVPINESIDEEATLGEAIHMLVLGHVQSLLVTRDGKATGILRLSDVFEEVAAVIRAEGPD